VCIFYLRGFMMLWKLIVYILRLLSNVVPEVKPEMGSCLCVCPEVDASVLNLPGNVVGIFVVADINYMYSCM